MLWFCQLYQARKIRVVHALIFVVMGVGLEFVQGTMGYRRYDVLDMYANTLGVLLGWALALAFPRILPR